MFKKNKFSFLNVLKSKKKIHKINADKSKILKLYYIDSKFIKKKYYVYNLYLIYSYDECFTKIYMKFDF